MTIALIIRIRSIRWSENVWCMTGIYWDATFLHSYSYSNKIESLVNLLYIHVLGTSVARSMGEREIHYVHSASLAYEDGIVFMSGPFAARQ